ncbi:MAG: HD-GYP domain-containing protein [Lachnospiraceae bacterium]|jgi:HD-GYP domain-containing protein (c-di-GMP phosphodiesterase class II)|nr:HD-GYP domain-containing protein [Lachnospiraceae bacterium]
MRYLSIDNIEPGSFLGKPIYNSHGTILLGEHFQLTEVFLNRLKELGFVGLYIEDQVSEGIQIKDVISEQLRLEASLKLESIVKNRGSLSQVQPIISDIVDNIIENRNVMIQMHKLLGYHSYTYTHCINVGILSVCMGAKMGLNRDQLLKLGTAGILHDIGKNNIPKEILDKPGKLTGAEFEIIKGHPVFGYNMIKDTIELSSVTKIGVLQHHERCDGSGYPRGLKKDEISLYGKIIAIADTYDALTSDRSYRPAYSPFEAYEYLLGDGDTHYDIAIVNIFAKCIAVYPVGSCVELSDGAKAIVVKNSTLYALRPVVRNINTNEVIDLTNDKRYLSLCITKIIE